MRINWDTAESTCSGRCTRTELSRTVAALYEGANELQVRRHSPPYEGGVAVPSRKRTRSEMARTGWSLTSYVAECVLKHGARATTPSAPLRWLRSILLMAQPPLLHKEGNTRGEFID